MKAPNTFRFILLLLLFISCVVVLAVHKIPGTTQAAMFEVQAQSLFEPTFNVNFVSLFDGKTLNGWIQIPDHSWTVKDGAMASLGVSRGVIYTANDYSSYRLTFTMRHVSGKPDHSPCILVFCTRPTPGQQPLDALGGIQLQPPNGGHWDYRPGHNNGGRGVFTNLPHPKFDPNQWFGVEILVDAASGKARMAVAQPVGSKAVEVLDFDDPTASQTGPIAFQMHNKGLFDEYKDVKIEINPPYNGLITTR